MLYKLFTKYSCNSILFEYSGKDVRGYATEHFLYDDDEILDIGEVLLSDVEWIYFRGTVVGEMHEPYEL